MISFSLLSWGTNEVCFWRSLVLDTLSNYVRVTCSYFFFFLHMYLKHENTFYTSILIFYIAHFRIYVSHFLCPALTPFFRLLTRLYFLYFIIYEIDLYFILIFFSISCFEHSLLLYISNHSSICYVLPSARYFAEHYWMTGPTTADSYGRLITRILMGGTTVVLK